MKKAEKDLAETDLSGHTLMLNTSLVTKFQCGGFTLGSMRPFATVTSETQQVPLKRAILEGKLLDITGTDMAKGMKTRHGETSAIDEQDTGKKVVSPSCRNPTLSRAGARAGSMRRCFVHCELCFC